LPSELDNFVFENSDALTEIFNGQIDALENFTGFEANLSKRGSALQACALVKKSAAIFQALGESSGIVRERIYHLKAILRRFGRGLISRGLGQRRREKQVSDEKRKNRVREQTGRWIAHHQSHIVAFKANPCRLSRAGLRKDIFFTVLVYNDRSLEMIKSVVGRRRKRMPVESMKVRPGIEVAGLSDVGCQRENNEDSFLYWEPADDREFKRKGRLAVVADGMGGYEGGLEASRLAVETVREVYDRVMRNDPQVALVEAFLTAHDKILNYAVENPELQGMGTTCTALVICDRQIHVAHVGDSRLYLLRDAEISRLTRDHSYVGRLVESGIVRAEDAERHPQRHILTAALGAGTELSVDGIERSVKLQDGDELLLCTDGLWGVVGEDELQSAMASYAPNECCQALVKLARERGGPDNITLQVLRVVPED
jgi:protein phosphatase